MATLTDFRLRISAKMGLDNTVSGDQGLIDSWVNEAVSEVLQRTRVQVQLGTMAVTAGTADYTLSTNILAIDDLYITGLSDSTQHQLLRRSPSEILNMRIGSSGGTPPVRFFALNGAFTLMLYPTPNQADTITIYYVPRPATLTAGSDTPTDIPTEYHKAVEYYGLWQAGQYTNDSQSQEGETFHKMYESELVVLKRGIRQRGGRKLSPAVVGRRRANVGAPSQLDV